MVVSVLSWALSNIPSGCYLRNSETNKQAQCPYLLGLPSSIMRQSDNPQITIWYEQKKLPCLEVKHALRLQETQDGTRESPLSPCQKACQLREQPGSSSVDRVLGSHPEIPVCCHCPRVWWRCITGMLAFRESRQEGWEFKAIFSYIASSRLTWAT